ncbi:MAG TPA: GNAT family N-acetyltransferase [Gemmatimonadaceae bacterium]
MVPGFLRTPRLVLRRWRETDAAELLPILEANVGHLRGWIPTHVAEPVPYEQIVGRIERFVAAFDAGREWRYALVSADTRRLLGEVSLFPRVAVKRVPFDAADHIEIGYWLRADATGQGYATEATRAAMSLALSLPKMSRLTIHCDERNTASAALPRRLGFYLAATIEEPSCRIQIWEYTPPI